MGFARRVPSPIPLLHRPEGMPDEEAPVSFVTGEGRGRGWTNARLGAVIRAIQSIGGMPQNVSVTVIEHANGTVSVGLSASGRGASVRPPGQKGPDTQDRRPYPVRVAELANAAAGAPPDAPIYNSGPPPAIADVNRVYPGLAANNCSEPHAASVAAGNTSEVTGYQTGWAGSDESNNYRMGNPPARAGDDLNSPTLMHPCATCGHEHNAGLYDETMNSDPPPQGDGAAAAPASDE